MDKETIRQDEYTDLCVTCKNYSSCMYVKNGKRPIHHCEEFEVYEFRPAKEHRDPVQTKKKKEELIYYGLCKNCGNRFTCMNASPDRIIWHCEEYV